MVAVRLIPPPGDLVEPESHRRLRSTALQLSEATSFEDVTVEQIARAASVSRRTFHRYFPAKEDVLFSDHAGYLLTMERTLGVSSGNDPSVVPDALRTIIDGYLEDANFAFRREMLVRKTPTLIDRESLWFAEYQAVVAAFLRRTAMSADEESMAAILAAAMVAAVRQAVAEWFVAPEAAQPRLRLGDLLDRVAVLNAAGPPGTRAGEGKREVVVVTTSLPADHIAALIRDAGD